MSYYLIYEQGSIDEGTETRIVGPFTYETHADEVFYQHSQGGAGWDERWEHVGSITGSVQGFRVEPATLLVDHYPQTPEVHEAAMERVRWLVGRGFEPIEIRHPRPLTPAQQKEREMLGRMWSAHLTDMMERKTGLAGWLFNDGRLTRGEVVAEVSEGPDEKTGRLDFHVEFPALGGERAEGT